MVLGPRLGTTKLGQHTINVWRSLYHAAVSYSISIGVPTGVDCDTLTRLRPNEFELISTQEC